MKTQEEVYRLLFLALQTGELKNIIQTGYDLLKRPLIITDTSFHKLTELCPDTPCGDPKWDIYLEGRELNLESVKYIFEYDDMNQTLLSRESPFIMRKGHFADSPRLTAPVRSDGHTLGYVSMLCILPEEREHIVQSSESPAGGATDNALICSQYQIDTIAVIADTVALYLRQFRTRQMDLITMRHLFTEKLIGGEIDGEDEIREWLDILKMEIRPHYMILAMEEKKEGSSHFWQNYSSMVDFVNLPLLMCQSGRRVYGLLYDMDNKQTRRYYLDHLRKILENLHIACGISRSFQSFSQVAQYKRQSEIALRIGTEQKMQEHMYYYRDLTLRAIMSALNEFLGYENTIHPAISVLGWFDETYNTEYLQTLRVLTMNGFQSAAACEKLHIHRNTLNYRKSRIAELTEIDLYDPDTRLHLEISFRIMNA